jgi:hypothetical protein
MLAASAPKEAPVAEAAKTAFRDYSQASDTVRATYQVRPPLPFFSRFFFPQRFCTRLTSCGRHRQENHAKQTLAHVLAMKAKYTGSQRVRLRCNAC